MEAAVSNQILPTALPIIPVNLLQHLVRRDKGNYYILSLGGRLLASNRFDSELSYARRSGQMLLCSVPYITCRQPYLQSFSSVASKQRLWSISPV